MVYACTVCNTQGAIHEPIAPLGHTEITVPAIEQSCTAEGRSERIYCGVCKALIKASRVIEPHFYHIEVTKKPTCDEAGECTKYCVVCEHTVEGAVIPPSGHTDRNGDIICDECGTICGDYRDDAVIEIATADELAALKNALGGIYRLTADITLPSGWIPLGTKDTPFSGYLDGNGHTITLCAFEDVAVAGLFGYNSGVIVDLTVTGINAYATDKDMVFGGIAAYNTGVISNCQATGEAFVTLKATSIGAAEGTARAVRSVVFGCLVGVNEPSGRLFGNTLSTPLLAKIDNTAKSTATNTLIGWLTKSFQSIHVESIASLSVGTVVGRNNGTIAACTVTGLMQIGEFRGVGTPSAIAENHYGCATAENNYYCGSIAGIDNGEISDCDTPQPIQFNLPLETAYNIKSFITYTEKTICRVFCKDI